MRTGRLRSVDSVAADADASDLDSAPACVFGPFGPPVNLGPGFNSTSNDWAPALRTDGLEVIFESDRGGGRHLYVTTRATVGDSFGSVVRLDALNSGGTDADPTLLPDGLTMYFVSTRSGPSVLYVTTRASLTSAWTTPMVVAGFTGEDMHGPTISADDNELFYDRETVGEVMVRAHRNATTWVVDGPVAELNQMASGYPSLSRDGLTLFFAASSGGPGLIYQAIRPAVGAPFSPPTAVALQTPSGSSDDDPEISADSLTVLFASNRPGGLGASDLWMATRTCL